MEKTKRKAFKSGSVLAGAFLMSALIPEGIPAQERQRQQARQPAQQQSQTMNRGAFPDDVLEDLVVIRMAERASLVNVIKVNVRDGVATLSGKVPSDRAEQRALRIARTTRGITSVRDEISVDKSMTRRDAPVIAEAELVKQVAQRIAKNIEGAKAGEDWWFDGWRVEGEFNTWSLVVEVDEPSRVILEGEVPSLDIMRKAIEAAYAVPSVLGVDPNLELDRDYAYGAYGGYPYTGYPYRSGSPYADGYRNRVYGYPYGWGHPYYPAYGFGFPADERQSRAEGQNVR